MSRIPKIGFTPSSTNSQQENFLQPALKRPTERTLKPSVKRRSDEQIALTEKRQKTNVGAPVRNKALGTIQPSQTLDKIVPFSARAKRAVLQPIPDSALVRGSMPAVSLSSLKPKVPGKSKRPAWDLKGRMQDMEEHFQRTQLQNANLKEELGAYNQRIAALEAANSLLHQDVEIKSVQSEEASSQIRQLEDYLRQKTDECEALTKEKNALFQKLVTMKSDYENLQTVYHQETSALKSSITNLTCSKSGLQAQLDAMEVLLERKKEENKHMKERCSEKERQNESLLQHIADLESKLREEESIRRKLHNTVQELKGNIRVYCRIRPPLPEELKNGVTIANINAVSEKMIEVHQLNDIGMNESGGKGQPKYEFSFDCVFPPSASQEEIFNEISQLVQSSLDGYNVCIFAYGQTGSGKTYTMEGPENIVDFSSNRNDSRLGMIPRSIKQIFESVANLEPKGWKYKIQALFLEIYNERIQDLLTSQNGSTKCEIIKSGSKGNDCLLSNATTTEVTSAEQVYDLLKKARINRAVAATKCNEHSSRSHYIFQLKICGENAITCEKCDGTLNLVDLAGSERVKESGSYGDRLTEAKAINKSLSNLGNVIMSLSRKESHIPYRDSKLTHLLSNSLGGNSKTLMFVNISPDNDHLNETINSLRFATKVNQCNIGTAQKRIK